jgi:hypothetical protein
MGTLHVYAKLKPKEPQAVMKILLVSDKEDSYIWDYFDRERFRDIDMMISCGDLAAEYLSFLVTMIKAPLFYVPGNHNGGYLQNPPQGCESIDGRLVTYKGVRLLGLGGSYKYSHKEFQYTEKEMKKRAAKLKWKIRRQKGFDILVSHAPAHGIGDGEDICHRGFKTFLELMDEHSPKYLIHGHQHLSYGRQPRVHRYKDTRVVNAYGYHILEY